MKGYNQSESHMTNDKLYQSTGQRPISKEIERRQLKFTGHCLRMEPDEPVNTYVLYESKRPSAGRRRKGRPTLTYLAQIANYINVQKDENAAKVISKCACDRKGWNELIAGIYTPAPRLIRDAPASNSVLDVPGEPAR